MKLIFRQSLLNLKSDKEKAVSHDTALILSYAVPFSSALSSQIVPMSIAL